MNYSSFFRSVYIGAVGLVLSIGAILSFIGHTAWRFIDIRSEVKQALDLLGRMFLSLFVRLPGAQTFVAFVERARQHQRYRGGAFIFGTSTT